MTSVDKQVNITDGQIKEEMLRMTELMRKRHIKLPLVPHKFLTKEEVGNDVFLHYFCVHPIDFLWRPNVEKIDVLAFCIYARKGGRVNHILEEEPNLFAWTIPEVFEAWFCDHGEKPHIRLIKIHPESHHHLIDEEGNIHHIRKSAKKLHKDAWSNVLLHINKNKEAFA